MQACKEAGYDVSEYEAALGSGDDNNNNQADAAERSRRPDWLNEIVESGGGGGGRSRSRSPDRGGASSSADAAAASSGWDERWGYSKPREWRGPQGRQGRGGQSVLPPGPRKGLFLQRCPYWAGGRGKCKKGQKCQFAHGDAELASKEVKQQIKEQLARKQGLHGYSTLPNAVSSTAEDNAPVRQRAIRDDEPVYEEYEKLAEKAAGPKGSSSQADRDMAALVDAVAAPAAATSSAATMEDGLIKHRDDGMPMGFMSRDAKQESLRQHRLEQQYEAEQAAWGFAAQPGLSSSSTSASAAAAAAAAGSSSTVVASAATTTTASSLAAAGLGRGKSILRPAWVVRKERGEPYRSAIDRPPPPPRGGPPPPPPQQQHYSQPPYYSRGGGGGYYRR